MLFQHFCENLENLSKILKPCARHNFGHRFFPDLSLGMNEVTYLISIYDKSQHDCPGIEKDITIFVTKTYK